MSVTEKNKLIMCGCQEGGVKAVEGLLDADYEFSAFVCLTPRQAEKYAISGYYDYRPLAKHCDIPVYVPQTYSLADPEDEQFFRDQRFDLLVQGGWQRLFPEKILCQLRIGALGLHGSADLLPKGQGRSPMNWSLIEGRKRFLMHLFMIKPGVDDGDVIGIREFDITTFDDIETLYFKYNLVYRSLLIEYLPAIISGEAETLPQVGQASYYPKRTAEDGRINWEEMDVWELHNFIRAQTRPYPGAFGKIGGIDLVIWKARPFDTRIRYDDAPYGQIVERFGEKLLINCRGGLLLIDEWHERP